MNLRHLKAVEMGGCTLVGVMGREYPLARGNCFDLIAEDGKPYRIVNFVYENFTELQRLGLEWPVHIVVLGERVAAISDPRIGDRWHQTKFCEVCCPEQLLPTPQILKNHRMECRGERATKNGWTERIYMGEKPKFQ